MGTRRVIAAVTTVFVLISLASVLPAASCTQANPDWVYVTTITGTKSQDINVNDFVPSQYHWGIRGRFTGTGDASLELFYDGSEAKTTLIDDDGTRTYIVDLDPARNVDPGNSSLRVTATDVTKYELNFYYDANLGNETTSISPSPSPLHSPTQNPLFPTFTILIVIVLIAAAAAISLVYIRIQRKG